MRGRDHDHRDSAREHRGLGATARCSITARMFQRRPALIEGKTQCQSFARHDAKGSADAPRGHPAPHPAHPKGLAPQRPRQEFDHQSAWRACMLHPLKGPQSDGVSEPVMNPLKRKSSLGRTLTGSPITAAGGSGITTAISAPGAEGRSPREFIAGQIATTQVSDRRGARSRARRRQAFPGLIHRGFLGLSERPAMPSRRCRGHPDRAS